MVLDNVVAMQGTSFEVKKVRLGDLFWYSVSEDIEIDRDTLVKMFDDLGIDHGFLPNAIRQCDAFKRATSALQENRIEITEDGSQFANLMIRDVRTRGDIVRHLVQEIVDQENVQLGYEEVASYGFSADTGIINYKFLQHPVVSEVLEGKIRNTRDILEQLYPKFCNVYNGRHIREVVKNILDSSNPTAVRPSGALYFIPYFHNDTLDKLEKLLDLLSETTDRTVECHTIELYNADKHKVMLAGKVTTQMDEKVEELIEKIASSLAGSRGIKPVVAETFYTEYRQMLKFTGEYEELLEQKLVEARSKLDILKEQIQTMFDKIDVANFNDVPKGLEETTAV